MKKITILLMSSLSLVACNNQNTVESAGAHTENAVASEVVNGKYNTDFETAQELKGMKNTIENFTLLNKKKFENLKAYQEFGDLMQMHIDTVTNACKLDANTKSLLCKKLDGIKAEVQILHGTDMVKSKDALTRINSAFAEIDSTFNYAN